MKLKSYHNPENVDESKVPDGWRFRYADEIHIPIVTHTCKTWIAKSGRFSYWADYIGTWMGSTYIVLIEGIAPYPDDGCEDIP